MHLVHSWKPGIMWLRTKLAANFVGRRDLPNRGRHRSKTGTEGKKDLQPYICILVATPVPTGENRIFTLEFSAYLKRVNSTMSLQGRSAGALSPSLITVGLVRVRACVEANFLPRIRYHYWEVDWYPRALLPFAFWSRISPAAHAILS